MIRTAKTLLPLLIVLILIPAAVLADAEQEMSADEQAMMMAWMKAATPGEAHAAMADHTGSWKATMKSWMPGATEPMINEGSFERELVLGGRVLQERFAGSFAGQPFNGFSQSGYDNVTKRHWTTWTDDMSTGILLMWGNWDEKEKAFVYHGEGPDPMTGGMVESKIIVRFPEKGKEVMEMYDLRTGEPVKMMEIVSVKQ